MYQRNVLNVNVNIYMNIILDPIHILFTCALLIIIEQKKKGIMKYERDSRGEIYLYATSNPEMKVPSGNTARERRALECPLKVCNAVAAS